MKTQITLKSILSNDLVKGMVIPALFYWAAGHFFSGFSICLITLIYSMSIVLLGAVKEKKFNLFGLITLLLSGISLLGMFYFKTERFVQYNGIVTNIIMSVVFLASLLGERSLLQQFVENSPNNFGATFKQSELYKRIWRNETIMWSVYYLIMSCFKTGLMLSVSTATYFSVNYIVSQGSFYALLAFSYYYPAVKIRKETTQETAHVI